MDGEGVRKLSYLPVGSKPLSERIPAEVVYYQDETAPPDRAWRWKFVSGETVISTSDGTYKTRRGAMDDFNQIRSVMDRLQKGTTE